MKKLREKIVRTKRCETNKEKERTGRGKDGRGRKNSKDNVRGKNQAETKEVT